MSVDPLEGSYPWYTPYQFAGNMPIKFIDLDGLEPADPADPTNTDNTIYKGGTLDEFTATASNGQDQRQPINLGELDNSCESIAGCHLGNDRPSNQLRQEIRYEQYMINYLNLDHENGQHYFPSILPPSAYRMKGKRQHVGDDGVSRYVDINGYVTDITVPLELRRLKVPRWFANAYNLSGMTSRTINSAINLSNRAKNATQLGLVRGAESVLRGVYSYDEAMLAGRLFVGRNATPILKNGRLKGYLSADKLRRFRVPQFKQRQGRVQANFEYRNAASVKWKGRSSESLRSNIHSNGK